MKRVGLLRILQDDETIIPCLLSIASIMDDIVVIWSEDCAAISVDKIKRWAKFLDNTYGLRLHFRKYPFHVVRPNSVPRIKAVPVDNRADTYCNFGMDIAKSLYPFEEFLVVKIDADQVYLTENFDKALSTIQSSEDAVAITGYNSFVMDNTIKLYATHPKNGGMGYLACGNKNLPKYRAGIYVEVDKIKHPSVTKYPDPCWMHFMREHKSHGKICTFEKNHAAPISTLPELPDVYTKQVLPYLEKGKSLYTGLIWD